MILCLSMFLVGCQSQLQADSQDLQNEQLSLSQNNSDKTSDDQDQSQNEGNKDMEQLMITIDNQDFSITLEKNETVNALFEQLPMSITMDELHGNEKYYYMKKKLPTNAKSISHIEAGDFMLFGNDCLVLFYENFSSSYSYTRLGHIDDVAAFVRKVDSGTMNVTIHQ